MHDGQEKWSCHSYPLLLELLNACLTVFVAFLKALYVRKYLANKDNITMLCTRVAQIV